MVIDLLVHWMCPFFRYLYNLYIWNCHHGFPIEKDITNYKSGVDEQRLFVMGF